MFISVYIIDELLSDERLKHNHIVVYVYFPKMKRLGQVMGQLMFIMKF